MKNRPTAIQPYNDSFRDQIISVWEKSVRATHEFLAPADIEYYKKIVATIDFKTFEVFCVTQEEIVLGFMGILGDKIEMLFISPEYIGQGLGKKLLLFGINQLKADKVDVNEQNHGAVKFYEKFGFVPYDRTDKDSEGKNYPILKMKLGNSR